MHTSLGQGMPRLFLLDLGVLLVEMTQCFFMRDPGRNHEGPLHFFPGPCCQLVGDLEALPGLLPCHGSLGGVLWGVGALGSLLCVGKEGWLAGRVVLGAFSGCTVCACSHLVCVEREDQVGGDWGLVSYAKSRPWTSPGENPFILESYRYTSLFLLQVPVKCLS